MTKKSGAVVRAKTLAEYMLLGAMYLLTFLVNKYRILPLMRLFWFATVLVRSSILFAAASSTWAVASECFLVSGEKRSDGQIFSDEIRTIGQRCQIVSSWKEIHPLSSQGSPVLIIQEAHGNPGGTAILNSGDETASQILDEVSRLATVHPLGIYLRSCYSGDLLQIFLTKRPDLSNRVCLITQSVPHRAASIREGSRAVAKLLGSFSGESLLDFIKRDSLDDHQGLSSAAAWEKAGYIRMMESGEADADVVDRIRPMLDPDSSLVDWNRESPRNLLIGACNGMGQADLARIAKTTLTESLYVAFKGLKTPPNLPTRLEMRNEMIATVRKMDAFPPFSKPAEDAISECRVQDRPFSCLIRKLSPDPECKDLTPEKSTALANLLLGKDDHLRGQTNVDNIPVNDPVHLLHDFSIQSLGQRTPRTDQDRERFQACATFIVNP